MFIKKQILLCVLLCFCFGFQAQECDLKIRGTIQDQDNSETLGFAVVKLVMPERIMQTNENGEFVLDKLCAGVYQILVQHLGCRDTIFTVKLDRSKKVVFKLPHSFNNLGEVDIMDKRIEMQKTQAVDQLSAEEMYKTKGQSLGETLKELAGVTTLNTGATVSKPMLHGMQGYRLLILNNGIRQEGQQWGNEHAPEIDPFIAKKISVIKGVSAIRYGSDAIAGVVLVEPDNLPDTAAVTGEVNLIGLSNGRAGAMSGMLEGNFRKLKQFSWRAQGSMKKGGSVKTPDYYLNNSGMEERNFSYTLGYHHKKVGAELYYSQFTTQLGIFRGAHSGNLTDLRNALARNKPVDSLSTFTYAFDRPRQEVRHDLFKSVLHYHISPRWRAKVQYARQVNIRQEYDLRRLTGQEKQSGVVNPDMDLRITTQTGDVLVEHDNIKSFRGMFGASYMHQANLYAGRFFVPNYLAKSAGIFAVERYLMRYVELEAGIRYDEKRLQSFFYQGKDWTEHVRNFKNVTYNAGLIWKPRSFLNLFVNAGSAWRAPAPNELYSNGIHQGAGTIERGDLNFESEVCNNITLSGIFRSEKLLVEVTTYYNRFKNFIYLNPTGELELTIRGAFPVFAYKQDHVRIHGADFKMEYAAFPFLTFVTKAMLVRGWNNSANDHLIYMPADRADLNLRFKIPGRSFLSRTSLQVSNQLVAKQWRAPAGVDFAPPPPAYYLLGLNVATELNIKKQKIIINLSATNLLNARYRDYLDRFRYYADAMGTSYNVRITLPLTLYSKTKLL